MASFLVPVRTHKLPPWLVLFKDSSEYSSTFLPVFDGLIENAKGIKYKGIVDISNPDGLELTTRTRAYEVGIPSLYMLDWKNELPRKLCGDGEEDCAWHSEKDITQMIDRWSEPLEVSEDGYTLKTTRQQAQPEKKKTAPEL